MKPFRMRRRFAFAIVAVSAVSVAHVLSAASAAHGAEPPSPIAADPHLGTAPPVYRSAFDGYKKFQSGPVSSWRNANDTVGAVGGHVGALRNAPSPAASPPGIAAPEAPAPKAAPVKPVTGGAGHLGHH